MKTILDTAYSISLEQLHYDEDATLRISLLELELHKEPENVEVAGYIFEDVNRIESNANSRKFLITFQSPVVWQVIDESYFSNEYYFVLKGCIRCYSMIDGEENTIEFYTEAESYSPFSCVNKTPSKYFVSCVEDCVLSVATPEIENEVFKKFPRFESLCRIFSEKLLAKNQVSFANFKNSTPEQRYLNLIKTRPDLIQRVPQYHIASYLGIKPESLSRIRQRVMNK